MVRQRVDIHGQVRPMESAELLPALKLAPREIGIMKEAPVLRWQAGQDEWDQRYKHNALQAIKQRSQIEAKVEKLMERARAQGLVAHPGLAASHNPPLNGPSTRFLKSKNPVIQVDRRWGPLDLEFENPPPTAIANRRDTVRIPV